MRDPVVLIFWAVALLLLAVAGWSGWNQHQIAGWARVSGQVVSSRVLPDAHGKYVGELTVRTADGERQVRTGWASQLASRMQATLDETPAGTNLAFPQNPADAKDLRWPPQPQDAIMPWALAGGALLFVFIPVGVVALSQRKDAIKIAGSIFLVLGLGMIAGGLVVGYSRIDVLRHWPAVEGTVISSWEVQRSRRIWGVDAEFAYVVDGREIRSVLGSRGRSGLLPAGSKHWLRYQPGHPKVASFEAGWTLGYFWEGLVLGLVGLGIGGLGLGMRKLS
ncbi:MAG: DUF3592 domain-containing protein [Candidatus Eremiobacteraeota bacterium]|nr:DUF3592 domain-containing protein [Candidatus Eremiobacteraeota bacterium]MCW5868711.1 DUF3592 domain-containing protein [Candidatus Eremiobacteraeota bacterium]